MPAPISFSEVSKLLLPFSRGPTLYPFYQIGGAQGRRTRSKYVYVIGPNVPLFHPNIQTEACLADELPRPMGDFFLQNVVSVLCDPYQMVLNLIDRM